MKMTHFPQQPIAQNLEGESEVHNVFDMVTKGYPEYNSGQSRDEKGRWSGKGSGSSGSQDSSSSDSRGFLREATVAARNAGFVEDRVRSSMRWINIDEGTSYSITAFRPSADLVRRGVRDGFELHVQNARGGKVESTVIFNNRGRMTTLPLNQANIQRVIETKIAEKD